MDPVNGIIVEWKNTYHLKSRKRGTRGNVIILIVTSKMEVKEKFSTSYFSVEVGMQFLYDKDNPCVQICLLPNYVVGKTVWEPISMSEFTVFIKQ